MGEKCYKLILPPPSIRPRPRLPIGGFLLWIGVFAGRLKRLPRALDTPGTGRAESRAVTQAVLKKLVVETTGRVSRRSVNSYPPKRWATAGVIGGPSVRARR